jgi:hypothetical protein
MSFFDSEIVRKEANEISFLQQDIMKRMARIPIMERDERIQFFDDMIDLIDRQKIFYSRLSLSDDPKAQELKEQFRQAAAILGMPSGHMNMMDIYEDFKKSMELVRQQVLDGTL